MKDNNDRRKRGRWIFRSSIIRNGERIYAKDYGHKAFRIWIED